MELLQDISIHEEEKRKKRGHRTIVEIIEDDWELLKKFVNEKRKYFFWIITFFIMVNYIDIYTVGNTWNNICSQNPQLRKQMGGAEGEGGNAPKTPNAPDAPKTPNAPDAPNKPKSDTNTNSNSPDKKKKGEKAENNNNLKKDPKKKDKLKKGSGPATSKMLSNIGGVFKRAFKMFVIILAIAGALSIPFVIIIIITYQIIKMIAKHFMLL